MPVDVIGRLAVVTSVDNSDLKAGFTDAVKLSREFYKSLDGKTGHITGAEDSLKRVTNQLKVADAHAKTFGASLRNSIVSGIVSGGTTAVAMIGSELLGSLGGGLGDIVKDSIQIAASMETTQVAFETMAGSAEKARDLLAELRVFAKESPLTFVQSSKVAGNLLAAGIKPEQTLPSIRMLSDAARGNPEIIDRLALAYTQVRSKGHLMGQELNQFAETGLPIEQALADVLGKQKDEIRMMVEAGRVGFPDVQKAMRKLTDEGGAFYGMTEKYSQTFSGQMDSLKDSVQMLKGEFGKAIIEEVGLKDMASDAGNFAMRMKDVVNEARPAIRFVGDVVKAGAQLGYLSVRMGSVIGGAAVNSLLDKFPVIRETVDLIRHGLHDIEAMRFDDAKVQDFANHLGDALGRGFDRIQKSETWKGFEKSWRDGIIDPLSKALEDFKVAQGHWEEAKKFVTRAEGVKDTDSLAHFLSTDEERAKGAAERVRREEQARKNAEAERENRWANAKATGDKAIQGPDTFDRSINWLGRALSTSDELAKSELKRKQQADKENAQPQGKYLGGGIFEQPPAKPRYIGGGMFEQPPTKMQPLPVDIVKADPWSDALHGMLGVSGGLIRHEAEKERDRPKDPMADALRGMLGASGGLLQDQVKRAQVRKVEIEQGRDSRIRDKYKPESEKFRDSADDLQRALEQKSITEREYSLAMADLVKSAADSFAQKLPTAQEYGSAELARSLAQATAGTQSNTAEAILSRMEELEKQQLAAAQQILVLLGSVPKPAPVVNMPQK